MHGYVLVNIGCKQLNSVCCTYVADERATNRNRKRPLLLPVLMLSCALESQAHVHTNGGSHLYPIKPLT